MSSFWQQNAAADAPWLPEPRTRYTENRLKEAAGLPINGPVPDWPAHRRPVTVLVLFTGIDGRNRVPTGGQKEIQCHA